MLYRKSFISESADIAEVIVNTWKDSYRNIFSASYLSSLSYERQEKRVRKLLQQENEVFFTALYNGRVIGMVSGRILEDGEYDCELESLYILPEFQHRGTGKILFSMILDEFREMGAKSMIIWTFKDNRERGFYKKMGGSMVSEKTTIIDGREIVHVSYTWEDLELF